MINVHISLIILIIVIPIAHHHHVVIIVVNHLILILIVAVLVILIVIVVHLMLADPLVEGFASLSRKVLRLVLRRVLKLLRMGRSLRGRGGLIQRVLHELLLLLLQSTIHRHVHAALRVTLGLLHGILS